MPAETTWIYPKRIVYVHLYGVVTVTDMNEQVQELVRRIEEGTPPVHVIVNGNGIERVDFTLNQSRLLYPPLDPKVGWTVFYGTNRLTRFFASTMMQLIKGQFGFFDSCEEALKFLVRTDETLKGLRAELARV